MVVNSKAQVYGKLMVDGGVKQINEKKACTLKKETRYFASATQPLDRKLNLLSHDN